MRASLYVAAIHRQGRNSTVDSSVFWCARNARSKSGWPVVAGALIWYLPRARPTSQVAITSSSTLSSVINAAGEAGFMAGFQAGDGRHSSAYLAAMARVLVPLPDTDF